ncbi:MAG: hypothetical protein CBD74_12045 [Saprospirales bacterium TMED214]|nr:MAG: hypothetical protein CBD74_12045 [Saprospirales bacterium TMED214]
MNGRKDQLRSNWIDCLGGAGGTQIHISCPASVPPQHQRHHSISATTASVPPQEQCQNKHMTQSGHSLFQPESVQPDTEIRTRSDRDSTPSKMWMRGDSY